MNGTRNSLNSVKGRSTNECLIADVICHAAKYSDSKRLQRDVIA